MKTKIHISYYITILHALRLFFLKDLTPRVSFKQPIEFGHLYFSLMSHVVWTSVYLLIY